MRTSSLVIIILFCFAGFSHAQEIDSTPLRLEKEKERWNRALTQDTAYKFNRNPNAFLVKSITAMTPGKSLSVAMGQGRNVIYLASQGWAASGFDIADEALAEARKEAKRQGLYIHAIQESAEAFDFGQEKWDLITMLYAGCPDEATAQRLEKGLKPQGRLVFEFFHRDYGLQVNRPNFGCSVKELKSIFENLDRMEIIHLEEIEEAPDYGGKTNPNFKPVKLIQMVVKRE